MSFVKLDEKMLYSSIWTDVPARNLFITALLKARPFVLDEAVPQLCLESLERTGWEVPAGRYGLVEAAAPGLIHAAVLGKVEGMAALERLGSPEGDSGSEEFAGRRLVRINGGFVVLNYAKYRDKDHSGAERQRRYRERKRKVVRRKTREEREVEGANAAQGEIRRAEASA